MGQQVACEKVKYPSEQAALRALGRCMRARRRKRNFSRDESRCYRCHACKEWHLTSNEE